MIAAWDVLGFTLLDPAFLVGIPLLLVLGALRHLREGAALPAAQTALFADLPRTLRARLVHLPHWLAVLAGCVLVVALARPVQRELVPRLEEGIDIVLAVDVSSSMTIPDMDESGTRTRMVAARERALEFARARPNDRVALVTFARYAELRCPPTLDEEALASFVTAVDTVPPGSELDATAIGVGLAKAVQVLEDSPARSRVVVLLTDGQTTVAGSDTISSEDAAKLADDADVRVHTIGLGHGQPMPGGFVRLDFQELKDISERTGGRFFEARTEQDLGRVYALIDELEKTPIEDPRYRTIDHFEAPLLGGLLGLLCAILLETLWIRRVP